MNTEAFKTQSHVVWDCIYHIVIVPKYRKRVLFGAIKKELRENLHALSKQKGVEITEGHICPDHVHMVISIPPKLSVAHTVGFLKGKSAIRLHQQFSRKKPVTQKSFWSRGYFVRTVGIDREVAEKYVRDQWKKDKYIDGDQLDLNWI